ncbi:MAG: NADPH:quinone oxidoreductase family protein [Chloroflexota bacterium]|nr:NADPH:quinone oxidoreductase family protein [Chloroflexota bacterium]
MRAVLCEAFGAPESLVVSDVPSPLAGAGQVKIRVRAAGVNFPDALLVQGLYQLKPPLPFSPGLEVAGEICEVGAGVDPARLGARMMAILPYGGFAEEVVLPASAPILLPGTMPFAVAAGFGLAYGTAHVALVQRGRLQADETLLVLGAAGGVGLAAVELGALLGARVIAGASTDEKLALASRYGATDCINYSRENLRERIIGLTDGRGADVVFDPVGGDLFDQAVRRIAWEGRYLAIGFASGRIPALPANIALLKNASLVGVYWGAYWEKDASVARDSLAQLQAWYADGRLRPHIQQTFPLDEASQALRMLMERRAQGKIVLTL